MRSLREAVRGLLLPCALFGAATAVFPAAARAQTPPPDSESETKGDEKPEVTRLKAWPKVDEKAVGTEIERLRKARTAEMGKQAEKALIDVGAGVVPLLLPKYRNEKDEAAIARIERVLDTVTGPAHTRLLAESFQDRSAHLRRWALKRVAAFPDPGVVAQAERAYRTAIGRKKRDLDEEEVYAAALCVTSGGSFLGFAQLVSRAEKDWGESGSAIHIALTAVRGGEATALVAPGLDETSRKGKVAALRLLAACGEGDPAIRLVSPFLDTADNTLRIAAINALRGIVDGDPPLDKLSVFEAIERANKWKSRL